MGDWPSHTSQLQFLPGQWLDVFLPGLAKAGGFTITSTPREARPKEGTPGYLELAIQKSSNPPAQWLWQDGIEGQKIKVRVGGSFTWPPKGLQAERIQRLVLIAGGVGIKYVACKPEVDIADMIQSTDLNPHTPDTTASASEASPGCLSLWNKSWHVANRGREDPLPASPSGAPA